jgi:DNA sulfur modification protein DndD
MYISSIEVNNFRRYVGVVRLTFSPSPGRNIAVVAGANGCGKTSILLAILWCLYGMRLQWLDAGYRRLIRAAGDYSSFCRGMLNRLAQQAGQDDVYVELSFADVCVAGVTLDRVVLRRIFNATTSLESIHLTVGQASSQMVDPEAVDAFIEDNLVPISLAPYLFFDAERLAAIEGVWGIDGKQLDAALSAVAGFRSHEQLRDDLRSVRLRLRRESAKRPQRAAMDAIEQSTSAVRAELDSLSELIAAARDQRSQTLQQLDQLRGELARMGSIPSQASIADMESRRQALEREAEEIRGGLQSVLEVAPLAMAGRLLRALEGELAAERPDTRAWSEDDINRLAQSIIVELQTDNSSTIPDALAEKVLASAIKVLSELTHDTDSTNAAGRSQVLRDFSGEEKAALREVLASLRGGFDSRLSMSLRASRLNRREYARVMRTLSEASRVASSPDVQLAQQQLTALENRATQLDDELQQRNRDYGSLRSRLEELERQSASMVDGITVVERHLKADALAKDLIEELDSYIDTTRVQAAEALQERLRCAFAALLHKKNLVARASVVVGARDLTIDLTDAHGGRVLTDTLSRGEQQLCSMAVLIALLGMTSVPFPLFLDSPFQRLDEQHAANLVSGLQALSECQVVLLHLPGTDSTNQTWAALSATVSDAYLIEDQGEWSSVARQVPSDGLAAQANAVAG